MSKIDDLIARVEAKRSGRLHVTLKDGSTIEVRAADAIHLWLDGEIAHLEPAGSMAGQGKLLSLLAGLCDGDDD